MIYQLTELKKLRIAKHIEQYRFARRLGVSTGFYCMVENGERIPEPKLQRRIAKMLHTDVEVLWPQEPQVEQAGSESVLLGGR